MEAEKPGTSGITIRCVRGSQGFQAERHGYGPCSLDGWSVWHGLRSPFSGIDPVRGARGPSDQAESYVNLKGLVPLTIAPRIR